MDNYIRKTTDYLIQLRIEEIREKLSADGKLFDDLIFSVNPDDLEKCCYVGQENFATYDILLDKIWIWLFRFKEQTIRYNLTEDNVICNTILNIEHEWIHKLDSVCVGKSEYSKLDKEVIESVVAMQQQRLF